MPDCYVLCTLAIFKNIHCPILYQSYAFSFLALTISKQNLFLVVFTNKKEFQMKLIGWQKEGQGLTKEEYAAFTGEGAPAWMKEAIESMPKTIMQGPQFEQAAVYSAVGAGYGMIPGKGGALPFYQKIQPLNIMASRSTFWIHRDMPILGAKSNGS